MTLPNFPPLGATFSQERYLDSWRVILQPADVVVDTSAQVDYTSRSAVLAAPGVLDLGPADAVELAFALHYDPQPDYEQPVLSLRLLRIDPASTDAYISRRAGTVQIFGQDDAADTPVSGQELSATLQAMIDYSPTGVWAWPKSLTAPSPQVFESRAIGTGRSPLVRNVGSDPWGASGGKPPNILRGPMWGSEFFQLQIVSAVLTSGSALCVFGRRIAFEAIQLGGSRTGR